MSFTQKLCHGKVAQAGRPFHPVAAPTGVRPVVDYAMRVPTRTQSDSDGSDARQRRHATDASFTQYCQMSIIITARLAPESTPRRDISRNRIATARQQYGAAGHADCETAVLCSWSLDIAARAAAYDCRGGLCDRYDARSLESLPCVAACAEREQVIHERECSFKVRRVHMNALVIPGLRARLGTKVRNVAFG
jgi:hypothetical protein